jgi:hypothetical protein
MTVEELVERVRDAVNDYGDIEEAASTQLNGGVTAAAETFVVDDATGFEEGDWVYLEWEVCEVVGVVELTKTLTVIRGQRGTTAAIHADNTPVRANLRFSKLAVLNALNAALAGAYPYLVKVTEDVSLSVVAGQQIYNLPSVPMDIRSIWIAQTVGGTDYALCRSYEIVDRDTFVLYGDWNAGLTIKCIICTTFTRMTTTAAATLDSTFPDNDEAYAYLVNDAAGRLLLRIAASESLNPTALARGGDQQQDQRYVLLNAAKALRAEAQQSLIRARMQVPEKIEPRPDARYF